MNKLSFSERAQFGKKLQNSNYCLSLTHYDSNLSQVSQINFIKKSDHRVENGDWLATHHTMGSALMNKDFAEDSREYEVDLRYHSYIT